MLKCVISNTLTIFDPPSSLENYFKNLSRFNVKGASEDENEPEVLDLFKKNKDNSISIPRGFYKRLEDYCNKYKIKYKIEFDVAKGKPFNFKINPEVNYTSGKYGYQDSITDEILKYHTMRLEAPVACGKTTMSAVLCYKLQQGPVLFLTHRNRLGFQFRKTMTEVLGIPEDQIGIIQQKKYTVKPITSASLKTIGKESFDLEQLKNVFHTVILDETHVASMASTYRRVLLGLAPKHLIGLSATPDSDDMKEDHSRLMESLLGPVSVVLKVSDIPHILTPQSASKYTNMEFKFNVDENSPDWMRHRAFNKLQNDIMGHRERNELIVKDCINLIKSGYIPLVTTQRVLHAKTLYDMLTEAGYQGCLPYKFSITKKGEETKTVDHKKLDEGGELISEGKLQFMTGTLGLFREGVNLPAISAILFAAPMADNEIAIKQAAGRVTRLYKDKDSAIILDYVDFSYPNNILGDWGEGRAKIMEKCYDQHEYIKNK